MDIPLRRFQRCGGTGTGRGCELVVPGSTFGRACSTVTATECTSIVATSFMYRYCMRQFHSCKKPTNTGSLQSPSSESMHSKIDARKQTRCSQHVNEVFVLVARPHICGPVGGIIHHLKMDFDQPSIWDALAQKHACSCHA
jgi:hypothetical protein